MCFSRKALDIGTDFTVYLANLKAGWTQMDKSQELNIEKYHVWYWYFVAKKEKMSKSLFSKIPVPVPGK